MGTAPVVVVCGGEAFSLSAPMLLFYPKGSFQMSNQNPGPVPSAAGAEFIEPTRPSQGVGGAEQAAADAVLISGAPDEQNAGTDQGPDAERLPSAAGDSLTEERQPTMGGAAAQMSKEDVEKLGAVLSRSIDAIVKCVNDICGQHKSERAILAVDDHLWGLRLAYISLRWDVEEELDWSVLKTIGYLLDLYRNHQGGSYYDATGDYLVPKLNWDDVVDVARLWDERDDHVWTEDVNNAFYRIVAPRKWFYDLGGKLIGPVVDE
jgi:hypothetical protein